MPKYEVKVEATTQREIIVDAISEYEAWVLAQIEMVGLVGGENTQVISSKEIDDVLPK
jgi:predicted DNA-binding protein